MKSHMGAKSTAGDGGTEESDKGDSGDEWGWDRWKKHFEEVYEQERLIYVLKSQLGRAVRIEDYEEAGMLKVAIAAAATSDTVDMTTTYLNRAIAEERYKDSAFIRDNAGAGLVGWWTGISDDRDDPYGIIIRINAEHGRYVAQSYSPRLLFFLVTKRQKLPAAAPAAAPAPPAAAAHSTPVQAICNARIGTCIGVCFYCGFYNPMSRHLSQLSGAANTALFNAAQPTSHVKA